MKDDSLVVTTTKELANSVAQSIDSIDELGHISIHMAEEMTDKWTSGYDGIWMNEENNGISRPLTDINCFHMDI